MSDDKDFYFFILPTVSVSSSQIFFFLFVDVSVFHIRILGWPFFFLPPSFQHFELLFHYVLTPVVSDEKFCSHLSSCSPVYNVFFYSTKIFFLIFSLWQLDYNVWISSCAEFTDLLKSISRSFTKFRKLLVSISLISFFFFTFALLLCFSVRFQLPLYLTFKFLGSVLSFLLLFFF